MIHNYIIILFCQGLQRFCPTLRHIFIIYCNIIINYRSYVVRIESIHCQRSKPMKSKKTMGTGISHYGLIEIGWSMSYCFNKRAH